MKIAEIDHCMTSMSRYSLDAKLLEQTRDYRREVDLFQRRQNLMNWAAKEDLIRYGITALDLKSAAELYYPSEFIYANWMLRFAQNLILVHEPRSLRLKSLETGRATPE